MSRRASLARGYRRTGGDLPGGDVRPSHGAEMEGYFWRTTEAATGRVLVVLCGINRSAAGSWATVGVAGHPGGFVRATVAAEGRAETDRYAVEVPGVLEADADHLHVRLGGAAVDLTFGTPFPWPLRTAGGGVFSVLPFLGQYWHPHVLDAPVHGTVDLDGESWTFGDGAQLYAEKNWGRGFPEFWWWGQAHGFSRRDVTVAFTGGVLDAGPVATVVGGIVVRLGDRLIRLTPPTARMQADVGGGRWVAVGRRRGVEVRIEGAGDPAAAHVLPVPVPAERRNVDSDFEHLAGTMAVEVRERGAVLFEGESRLAGLEIGFRPGHPALEEHGPAGIRIRSSSMSPRWSRSVLTPVPAPGR